MCVYVSMYVSIMLIICTQKYIWIKICKITNSDTKLVYRFLITVLYTYPIKTYVDSLYIKNINSHSIFCIESAINLAKLKHRSEHTTEKKNVSKETIRIWEFSLQNSKPVFPFLTCEERF